MSTRYVDGLLVNLLLSGFVFAQDYPVKTIRIVTASAGSGSDFIARLIASGIAGPLGQPIVVENRGGVAGGEALAKAPPDGHTLLVAGGGVFIGSLLRKVPFDPVRDF